MSNSEAAMLTDLYEFSMANGYLHALPATEGVFDVFFRHVPDDGGTVVLAGLEQVVDVLRHWHFSEKDVAYFRSLHLFSEDFLHYLATAKFTCSVWAIPEGTPVFPREPLLTVKGPLVQVQLLETLVLNIINHESLIATKARRICSAAGGRPVMEFGARRAQGPDAATYGARAAIIGGCSSTSNVLTARLFGVPAAGTMAHSWVEAFPSELESFQTWAKLYPDNCAMLVDTYDVLLSGVPNAIKVFRELKRRGHRPVGIRIDSGDIADLAIKARHMLDEAGFSEAKITASNALDEYAIEALWAKKAPIDNFGIGEKLITSATAPVLSGVYKMAAIEQNGRLIPKIKVSDSREKLTLPGRKQVYRLYRQERAVADVIALAGETMNAPLTVWSADPLVANERKQLDEFEAVPLQQEIFDRGRLVFPLPTLGRITAASRRQLNELSSAVLRLDHPERYSVLLTDGLKQLQNRVKTLQQV
ncbi:MAG: nicotinate phosphoribosyltransferase [Sporolactobacillus sp.]|jgi:nicotinate phosphoribosyltransferase|nr:nicotinate phosphoribosyltransferase [Sporolactobacillus sp.]